MDNRIQVAGVLDERELRLLLSLRVDDIGFPVGPGVRTPDLPDGIADSLASTVSPPQTSVAIVYLNSEKSLTQFFVHNPHFSKVQLHGPIAAEEVAKFRIRRPDLYLIRSIIVGGAAEDTLCQEVEALSPIVDAFLTDTRDPITGATGATGKTHDWSVSARLVRLSKRPIILAGGLNPQNVAQAIREVRPFAVDVHTGVEGRDGRKDVTLVQDFVKRARHAFSQVGADT